MKNNYGTRSDGEFDFIYTEGEEDPPGSKSDQTIVIEVDGEEKTFKSEDVQNLLSQQASATQKTQQVSAILKAAEKFDMKPEDFVSQAEGAFSVIAEMIDQGFVDEKGNILKKKADPKDIDFTPTPKDKNLGLPADKVADIVKKALEPFVKKLDGLEQDQSQLTRLRIADSIKDSFKNLKDKDISQLFAIANSDRTKTLMQHAETLSKAKVTEQSLTREEIAKEFGIDVKKFDANKLLEQDAKGGASTMFKDKKFSFKKGKDSVTPRQAMHEFLDKTT